ncbi:MAG: ECF-type sigma factor [Gemmatimonadales bacterium]
MPDQTWPGLTPGDSTDQLFALLYRELHGLAERHLARQGGKVTLGTTTLLHDLYLQMADRGGLHFPDRRHFLGYASRAMRGLVIDYVRRRGAAKRGGEFQLLSLDQQQVADPATEAEGLTKLGEAIDRLALIDPPLAQLVDLHFFCGMPFVEIATLRGVSTRTINRDWSRARVFLHQELTPVLKEHDPAPPGGGEQAEEQGSVE